MTQQTFIVTGAGGWLGRRFLRALEAGLPGYPGHENHAPPARIRCLAANDAEEEDLRRRFSLPLEIVRGDVRDPTSLDPLFRDADGAVLHHAAGLIHPRLRVRDLLEVNHKGTVNLLRAAERAGVRRAVVVSSNSPVGVSRNPAEVFDENSPLRPYMTYGRSKWLMERAVNEAGERGPLETVLLRPPWFYGPWQPPRQTLFFRMIRGGGAPILGNGEQRRSMAYVDNIAHAMLRAASIPEAKGQTYWIADERPYAMNEIVDTVERLLEGEFGLPCAHKRLRLPDFAGQIAQAADWTLQSLGLYHQKIHVLSEMNKTIACSISKAQRELGYRPAVALEEGMRRSIQSCLEAGETI